MKNLNIMTPINDLGYGVAGKNICKAMSSIGYKVSLFPISKPNFSSQEEADTFGPMLRQSQTFDKNAPCLKVWHEFSMAERIGKGRMLGFPFFEINKFDSQRKHHLSSCDDVLVASKWAQEIVNNEVPSAKTHVVPLGVDTNLFKSAEKKLNKDKFVFFNCGKWEKRKGHDKILMLIKNLKKQTNLNQKALLF